MVMNLSHELQEDQKSSIKSLITRVDWIIGTIFKKFKIANINKFN